MAVMATRAERSERFDRCRLVPELQPAVVYGYPDVESLSAAMLFDRGVYGRQANSTVRELEAQIAELETGPLMPTPVAHCTSSGHAALVVLAATLIGHKRRKVAVVRPCYGDNELLFSGPLAALGVEMVPVELGTSASDRTDGERVAQVLAGGDVAMVVVEVLSNPLIRLSDIPAIAAACNAQGTACVVDGTFTTPYLFRAFEHGADAVFHSLTKQLNGHSDVQGGITLMRRDHPAAEVLAERARLLGGGLGPWEAWLCLRGLRTGALRVERASHNATQLADWFATRPEVTRVLYPGRESAAAERLAQSLLPDGRGAMLSIEIHGGAPAVSHLIRSLRNIRLVPSLGDVCTTVTPPALSSHSGMTSDERQSQGICDNLLRISAGIEKIDVLIDDFSQAFEAP